MSGRPLFVTVAPNGARRTRADHPALPVTAAEIARTAAACREAGAAMIHLHVRDRDGRHSLDADAYRDAIAAIRRAAGPDLVVQITTESAGRYAMAEQTAAVRAVRPEAVSLALREFVPDEGAVADAARFFGWLAENRIAAQYILYDRADLARFRALRRRGAIPEERPSVLFVLGRHADPRPATPADLDRLLAAAGPGGLDGMEWGVCAFGPREYDCAVAAAARGGHCRVGFENNLVLRDGRRAPDNAALVAEVVDGARAIGRPVGDGATLRAMLRTGLPRERAA